MEYKGRQKSGEDLVVSETRDRKPSAAMPAPAPCLVVMYHYIREGYTPQGGLRGLTTAEFGEQLDLVCRELEPVDWTRFLNGRSGKSPPPRSFLLTFDDGLAEHFHPVADILESRGLRGVFFVPGIVLEEPVMLAAHALHVLLESRTPQELEEEVVAELAQREAAPPTELELSGDGLRVRYHYETPERARLKYLVNVHLPPRVRTEIVRRLFERHVGSYSEWGPRWYLSAGQAVDLQRRGHTIGAHGYTHDDLSRMSPQARTDDLREAARVLDDILGKRLRPISYPFGGFDEQVLKAAETAGFSPGFTTRREWARTESPVMGLPRVDTIYVAQTLEETGA